MRGILVIFFAVLFFILMCIEIRKIYIRLGKDRKQNICKNYREIGIASIVSVLLLSIGIYFLFVSEPPTEIPLIGIMGVIYGWFHKFALTL